MAYNLADCLKIMALSYSRLYTYIYRYYTILLATHTYVLQSAVRKVAPAAAAVDRPRPTNQSCLKLLIGFRKGSTRSTRSALGKLAHACK